MQNRHAAAHAAKRSHTNYAGPRERGHEGLKTSKTEPQEMGYVEKPPWDV